MLFVFVFTYRSFSFLSEAELSKVTQMFQDVIIDEDIPIRLFRTYLECQCMYRPKFAVEPYFELPGCPLQNRVILRRSSKPTSPLNRLPLEPPESSQYIGETIEATLALPTKMVQCHQLQLSSCGHGPDPMHYLRLVHPDTYSYIMKDAKDVLDPTQIGRCQLYILFPRSIEWFSEAGVSS